MTDTTTIFLATDGRHTTLGRGDAVEASTDLIVAVQRQGLQGWVAVLSGEYYSKQAVTLARVHGINEAPDEDWNAAVVAFLLIRKGAAR